MKLEEVLRNLIKQADIAYEAGYRSPLLQVAAREAEEALKQAIKNPR